MSMLEELLAGLVSAEQAGPLLEEAIACRDLATLAYEARLEALKETASQAAAGIWRSPDLLAALAGAKSDDLLLKMDAGGFVAAHGGGCDLDIEYHPLLPVERTVSDDDLGKALGFIEQARDKDTAELWFGALQGEARAYLHQVQGDVYLGRAIAAAEAIEHQLLAQLDPSDPYAPVNILVHAAIVALYFERKLAWRVEGAYRRFLASAQDGFIGWQQRADESPEYEFATSDALTTIVVDAREALLLRNPSDPAELARLDQLRPRPAFPPLVPAYEPPVVALPALGAFEPDVVALPNLLASLFGPAAEATGHVIDGLAAAADPRSRRTAAVLRAWAALARRYFSDFRGVAAELRECPVDEEALGVVVQALRGEALYRLGQYEDAYLDLLRAERAARAALGRRTAGGDVDPASWTRAELDGVARLAQKAGNALAAIGDEDAARQAYGRASQVAIDPLSRAGDLVNQGNLQFLHNSVVGGQGYISLDAVARQDFVLHGPQQLIATVAGRHVRSLSEAERCYRAALDELARVSPETPGYKNLLATCHINLGNVAWAWGRTLTVEATGRLGDLPLGDAFRSQMVGQDSDARACYEAAAAGYEAGLAALGAGDGAGDGGLPADVVALAAIALSSLSEVRFLVGRELACAAAVGASDPAAFWPPAPARGDAAYMGVLKGISEGRRCLALLGKDAANLYPDLLWRTNYNLACSFRLLGKWPTAAIYFRRAILLVERLRGNLRLEAFQTAFLHDKHGVYEGYIDFLLAEGAADPGRHMPEIFAIFERSRARAFLTLLQAANVKAGLPEALRERAEDLLAQVSACNEGVQAAVAADDRTETEKLLAQQKALARQWADLQSEIAAAQRRSGRARPPIPRLNQFQEALAEDQAYLAVLLGDEASFALLIDRNAARAFRLPSRRTIELLALPVLTYATWSNAETAAEFTAANVKLTDALLGPIDEAVGLKGYLTGELPSTAPGSAQEASTAPGSAQEASTPPGSAQEAPRMKHLLISPDGLLCYLPFDALLADRAGLAGLPQPFDYPDLRPFYLLSLADLSYVPSASAWLELGRRKRRKSRAGLMAVYNVHYDTPEPPLWAVEENILLKLGAVTSPPDMARITQAVKNAWPDLGNVYLRSRTDEGADEDASRQSTETNFLKVAPEARARVLMFHGHGIYNDRYPSLSGLIFNLAAPPDTPDRAAIPTREDGFLRVDELFQLELPGVELTLLAACQTALGAYRRGEGLSAVVRGFLYRGSPAVMATLWEVRADMTAFLLRVFFRMLGEQPHADRARLFSQAKRKAIPYVANLCLPYFWAPFVLWGHTGPLE